ncbi:MAG: tRNA1(Val) (adenine(37)-N6)-methyltransferase [Bacteroidales bacterium]|nr:tRNA1(Val) (adenine(37)-N6)-methyltransferase [Bacteroidales bacterium]
MRNASFQFKQFTVFQDKCAMKVGTDGVLLGAWVGLSKAKNLLDIGTGTGLLALMLTQRSPEILVTAVELDKAAAEQAKENVNCSPWKDRVEVVHENILDYCNDNKFDVIVSNPPYFNNNLLPPNRERTLARHNDHLTYPDLISKVVQLLNSNGRFSVIIPFNQKEEFIQLCNMHGLNTKRVVNVQTTPNAPFKRVLLEFSFNHNKEVDKRTLLIEENRHCYSSEYIELTKDFYLKM